MRISGRRSLNTAYARGLVAIVLCLASGLALARIDINPRPVTITLNWVGQDIVVTQDFCVSSTSGAQPTNATVIPYDVTVTGTFALVSGANQIPATLSWTDLTTGTEYPLTAGTGTGFVLAGEAPNCPGGNNARLKAVVTNADITAVPPGAYTQTLTVQVSNQGGGRKSFNDPVTFNLNLPDSIAITQLKDLDLGTFTGADLTASETVCVYRASGGLYGVTLTGSGAGGAFELANGTSTIPFTVTWTPQGGAAATASPGTLISGLSPTMTGDTTCANGATNNATLSATVTAASINTAVTQAGTHSGTLTILVEMQ